EGMKANFQRGACTATARLLRLVAALQISASAEGTARAAQDNAAAFRPLLLDLIECLGKTAKHLHRDRVHDLLMVELQDGNRSIGLERAVLELHCFLLRSNCRLGSR